MDRRHRLGHRVDHGDAAPGVTPQDPPRLGRVEERDPALDGGTDCRFAPRAAFETVASTPAEAEGELAALKEHIEHGHLRLVREAYLRRRNKEEADLVDQFLQEHDAIKQTRIATNLRRNGARFAIAAAAAITGDTRCVRPL